MEIEELSGGVLPGYSPILNLNPALRFGIHEYPVAPGGGKSLIRNFAQGIESVDDEAVLTYTIPMPQDGVTRDGTRDSRDSVLDFVQPGPPEGLQPQCP